MFRNNNAGWSGHPRCHQKQSFDIPIVDNESSDFLYKRQESQVSAMFGRLEGSGGREGKGTSEGSKALRWQKPYLPWCLM
jgi:hypothetical protein